ncbi:hypothetical protein [Citrobacter amalonaticus]|nr:hypothetical protein [Citrobacter amalonaticus]
MRLTVLDDDPGRKINLAQERYTVYLDGVEVKHVTPQTMRRVK